MYNKDSFTYGFEIEWGDIDRRLKLPEHLGKWDYSETDIVNLAEPFKYVCADPLGINPFMGGEINTVPTKTWLAQCQKISEIKQFFEYCNNYPSSNCLSHSHVHVHVPGLKDDIQALKRLTSYIYANQQLAVDKCGQYVDTGVKGTKTYMRYDGGRLMPLYMVENILAKATDFESFIKMQAAGKDGISMGRPFRYAINTYSLKHTNTVEFRMFRSSVNVKQIANCFQFVENFMDAALNDGKPVHQLLAEVNYQFPPFTFNIKQWEGWLKTKYDKSRGKKQRTYHELV